MILYLEEVPATSLNMLKGYQATYTCIYIYIIIDDRNNIIQGLEMHIYYCVTIYMYHPCFAFKMATDSS